MSRLHHSHRLLHFHPKKCWQHRVKSIATESRHSGFRRYHSFRDTHVSSIHSSTRVDICSLSGNHKIQKRGLKTTTVQSRIDDYKVINFRSRRCFSSVLRILVLAFCVFHWKRVPTIKPAAIECVLFKFRWQPLCCLSPYIGVWPSLHFDPKLQAFV